VSLAEEADPITGLEEVVLSPYDNAPGVLTTEMIRAATSAAVSASRSIS
jgi:hypothetical protein